jgi:hypothetical protein
MQGAEERRLRRISHTSQGGATEGNAADGALLVDQGIIHEISGLGTPLAAVAVAAVYLGLVIN